MESRSTCRAELDGRDLLEINDVAPLGARTDAKPSHRVVGCAALLALVENLRRAHGDDPKSWVPPEGNAHEALLVREFIAKARGEWTLPYPHEELCHCRTVPTRVVDQAIVAGAHTPEAVSRATSASTACGTCRPDVEKLLSYRLKSS